MIDTIKTVIEMVKNHGEEVLAGLGGLYLFLLAVVHLTPTTKDDEILGKIYEFVHKAAGFLKVKK